MKASGYGNAEIAEILGVSVGAVEQRWHRHCHRRDTDDPAAAERRAKL